MARVKLPQARDGFKICLQCRIEKDLEDFRFEPRVLCKRAARCKDCLSETARAWYKAHPERSKEMRERWVKKYPDRARMAAKVSQRRAAMDRQEARIAAGKALLEPRVTSDGFLCSKCRRRKPEEEFPPNRSTKDGLRCYCRDCNNRIARQHAKKPHIAEYRQKYMRNMALRRYGLTVDDFDRMYADQEAKCRICDDALVLQKTGGCAVDHCHKTGAIRGLLCARCNIGIGCFRDRPGLLRNAALYLEGRLNMRPSFLDLKREPDPETDEQKAANLAKGAGLKASLLSGVHVAHDGLTHIESRHGAEPVAPQPEELKNEAPPSEDPA